jgi:TPR repeat protein
MKYKKYVSTTLILFLISCTSTQNSNNKLYELIISAEGGDINAQNEVAQAYYFGKILERNELEGCKWAIKYAQNKESNNQTTIMLAGMCHKFGKLGNKDYFEAAKFFKKSASLGNPIANHEISSFYTQGLAGEQDSLKAFKHMLFAAQSGLDKSQYWIAIFYLNGFGTYKNESEAFCWFEVASIQGNKEAKKNFKSMLQRPPYDNYQLVNDRYCEGY